jgi:CRP/FNR family cyclic AMP-dependent transcriptional regulator
MLDDDIDFGLLIGAGGAVRSFKQGATIFKEGDQASELYVIQNGSVRIQLGNRSLSTLYFNDIFGEMALIEGGTRSASAIAATEVTLVTLSEKQFLFLVSQTPNFALQVMRAIARRLRTANKSTFW